MQQNEKEGQIEMKQSEQLNINQTSFSIDINSESTQELFLGKENTFENRIHYGNNCVFLLNKDKQPMLTLGPHWYFFTIALTIDIYYQQEVLNYLKNNMKHSWIDITIQIILGSSQIVFYILTALINPGIISNGLVLSEEQIQSKKFCEVCKVEKTAEVQHCLDCDVCVQEYDHHCPWVGKCIAKKNIIFFKAFIITTTLSFFYQLFIFLFYSNSQQ